jgi:hypothetical protein
MGSGTERMSSRAVPAATAAVAATVRGTRAPRAHVQGAVLRGRRLREYRRMIVALYRVPAAALNRRYRDPFDQLWHSLGTMYGPVPKPRPDQRSRKVSAERRIPVARWRLRRDRV